MFNKTSKVKLQGVNPALYRVILASRLCSPVDFEIIEGCMNERQRLEFLASGKSAIAPLQHDRGNAVDIVAYKNGELSSEYQLYHKIAEKILQVAKEMNVNVQWRAYCPEHNNIGHFYIDELPHRVKFNHNTGG